MAFLRARFDPFLQRETHSSSGGQTPGMRAHVPWETRFGCRGHVVRGGACAEILPARFFLFAHCSRQ